MADDRGAVLLAYPRTFALKNWPFFVFLLVLGLALATPAWLMGNHGIAVALLLLGFGVAALVALGGLAYEQFQPTVLALHERGILFRQRGEHFVPWSEVRSLERWVTRMEVGALETDEVLLELDTPAGKLVLGPLHGGVQAQQLVIDRTRLTPRDLGRR
jgi:hypothetical protein